DVKDNVRHRLVREIVMAYEKHHAHEVSLRHLKEKAKMQTDKTEEK
ncbi:MAG: hypothetical protein JNL03_04805, partial [Prolixibacteraceae bacterium]|nr:hypothetical protein [Prolixibacteraceae bacterium]